MSLAQILMALATPLARRIFIALGLAWVVYEGVSVSVELYLSNAAGQLLGLPPEIVAFLNLAGVFDGLSLISGALIARLSMAPLAQIIPDQGQAT